MVMDNNWNDLVSEFTKLGGVAENIFQKEGELGRGIFPIDPKKKAKIYTPSELMIGREDVYLEDKKVRIKKEKDYKNEIREFFTFYQDNFSWGVGGKHTHEEFEHGLKSFPSELKDILKSNGIIDIEQRYNTDFEKVVFNQFLKARAFEFRNKPVIVPFLELVNYSPKSLPLIKEENGIRHPDILLGYKEITHKYSISSPLFRWASVGFTCGEPIVFSLQFEIDLTQLDLTLKCEGKVLTDDQISISKSNRIIRIKGLPIAHIFNNEIYYLYLCEVFKNVGIEIDTQDFIHEILLINIEERKKILLKSSNVNNLASNLLRQAIEMELKLIVKANKKIL